MCDNPTDQMLCNSDQPESYKVLLFLSSVSMSSVCCKSKPNFEPFLTGQMDFNKCQYLVTIQEVDPWIAEYLRN